MICLFHSKQKPGSQHTTNNPTLVTVKEASQGGVTSLSSREGANTTGVTSKGSNDRRTRTRHTINNPNRVTVNEASRGWNPVRLEPSELTSQRVVSHGNMRGSSDRRTRTQHTTSNPTLVTVKGVSRVGDRPASNRGSREHSGGVMVTSKYQMTDGQGPSTLPAIQFL